MVRHPPTSTTAENRWRWATTLIVVVGLSLLGFVALAWFLSEPPDVPCDCPQLEAQAVSIAWLPEGDPTGSSTGFSTGLEGDKSSEVFLNYPASDPQRAVSTIRDRLSAAGLPVEMLSSGKTAFVNAGVLRISALADIEGRQVQVSVVLFSSDEQAPALLAPFVEALGTRTTGSVWNEHGQLTH